MKMLVLIMSLTLFVATSALAVVDSRTDIIGMYWDDTADNCCTPIAMVPTNVYIILTNPSMPAINGFECAFDIEGTAQPFLLGATFFSELALDVAAGFQNFIVGYGVDQITTEATVLATVSILNSTGAELFFKLHQSDPSSIIGSNQPMILVGVSDRRPLTSHTEFPFVSAYMGADECSTVATEATTWDNVKSLYK